MHLRVAYLGKVQLFHPARDRGAATSRPDPRLLFIRVILPQSEDACFVKGRQVAAALR